MRAGAVGGRLLLAFAVNIRRVLRPRNPALFNVARERSGGLAMPRSLCYEASSTRLPSGFAVP
jgi:hypothetical protein